MNDIAMKTNELILEIQKLPVQKQIYVIERSLHFLRRQEDILLMEKAASELYEDYSSDKELSVFTDIDFVNFYEAR
jgi:hypothetical protein